MFTEGGDNEEGGSELAGQQVTGKLPHPTHHHTPEVIRCLFLLQIVYEEGFFSYGGTRHYWLACLRRLPGGTVGTTRSYRIHAPTPENIDNDDCEQVKLVANGVADRKQRAYKYE